MHVIITDCFIFALCVAEIIVESWYWDYFLIVFFVSFCKERENQNVKYGESAILRI